MCSIELYGLMLAGYLYIEEGPVVPGFGPPLGGLCSVLQAAQHIPYRLLIQLLYMHRHNYQCCQPRRHLLMHPAIAAAVNTCSILLMHAIARISAILGLGTPILGFR